MPFGVSPRLVEGVESLVAILLAGPDFPWQWVQIRPHARQRMASVKVSVGLKSQLGLPHAQVVLVGKHKHVKDLSFDQELADKLVGVDEKLFKAALQQLQPDSTVALYLDLAKVISVSDQVSRHNSPSNSYAIFKELKALKVSKDVKVLNVVLYSEYDDVLASVVAVARAFPLYSRKTAPKTLTDVNIEVVVTNDKTLTEDDLKFLNAITEASRICARQVDTPCSELHSTAFVQEASQIVDQLSLPVTKTLIVGEALLSKGFGGIYHVGKAAANPPAFLCFSYSPPNAAKTFALVGKGIMYDTGGMQIKVKTAMPGMKCDMGGAAAMFGAFCSLVQAGFAENLHCLMCIAENNVSPLANRPDDIITMLSGKTVEVSNTDAEGRLVLADGVFYAARTLRAHTILDMATLTGAQAYASGKAHAAVLCNRAESETRVVEAGRRSGDLVHPLPYAPDLHFADLKSVVADMKNSNLGAMDGPPSAIAGLFIAAHLDFTDDLDWIHVDIAAPAVKNERATAFGIPLVCQLLGSHTNVPLLK